MKKLLNVLIITLALNFLAVVGLTGWLYKSAGVNHDKIAAIKAVLFPPTTQPDNTNSVPEPSTQPTLKLDELLAQAATRPSNEQVDLIQRSVDTQMLQLDLRERQLNDLQQQIQIARGQNQTLRDTLAKKQKALEDQEQQAKKLEEDQGFQDSLKLYKTMTGKQVKQIFLKLDDETMERYLQAMSPRDAARILKEFKTPDEVERVHLVMERMRQSPPATQPTAAGG
jgi:flagellar motility protein MotE (MotC chaperone)